MPTTFFFFDEVPVTNPKDKQKKGINNHEVSFSS